MIPNLKLNCEDLLWRYLGVAEDSAASPPHSFNRRKKKINLFCIKTNKKLRVAKVKTEQEVGKLLRCSSAINSFIQ
jgi:hypothetical protein